MRRKEEKWREKEEERAHIKPVGEITSSVCFFFSPSFLLFGVVGFFSPQNFIMVVEQNASTYLVTCMKRMENSLSMVYLGGGNTFVLLCSYVVYSELYAYSFTIALVVIWT